MLYPNGDTSIKPAVLIIEDEPQLRRALRGRLAGEGYRPVPAETGEEALRLFPLIRPELVILDLGLPGMSGLDVCGELRAQSRVPILILSAQIEERDKVAALDLGADDYLVKPFGMDELLARLRAQLRRWKELPAPQSRIVVGDLVIDCELRRVSVREQEVRLTATEYDIVLFLARNAGKVITHGTLLRHLGRSHTPEEIQALRVHVGNIRKKIEPDPSRPRYLTTEIGLGYCFRGVAEGDPR